MVVAVEFRYDLWSGVDSVRDEDLIDVHCLIPNGSYIHFKCTPQISVHELKEVRLEQMNHAIVKEKNTKISLNASLRLRFFVITLLYYSDLFLEI